MSKTIIKLEEKAELLLHDLKNCIKRVYKYSYLLVHSVLSATQG